MSYGIMGYRVDLDFIAKKIALPKEQRLAVRRFVAGRSLRDGKDFSIGLSNLLIGPPYAKDHSSEASYLGYALESLCGAYGNHLFNNPVSPFKGDFLEHIDAHFKANGIDLLHKLIYRGAPLGIPRADEFPLIGYLTNEEIGPLLTAAQSKDLKAETEPLSKLGEYLKPQIIEACEMFRDWLSEAKSNNQSLVAFYY
jgi:hypothetical protein